MKEPRKIICHIDVNSAFLSWTASYRVNVLGEELDLRDIPSAICGNKENRHGIILAKSGPAKKYGIKTGEPLYQALKKCPKLVTAPPDYKLYVDASLKFISILKEIAPVMEQYSIDEAWIDMTGTEKLYGPPVMAAEMIKNRIRDELGFTVNIGVSYNKLLAKMASDFEKPDRVHTLFADELPNKFWPLPVGDLFMVGRATAAKLESVGIRTIGQLAAADPEKLQRLLHKHGILIWDFANGRGEDRLSDTRSLNKGYGNSMTTAVDVRDTGAAQRILLSLCETVGMRMRRDKQSAGCVSVSIRSSEFVNTSHQRQLAQPTDSTLEIYRTACEIFDQLWDGHTPLRQLGVYLSHTEQEAVRQTCLFTTDKYEKQAKAEKTIDRIRARFGEDAVIRASFLNSEISPMGGGLSKERRSGVTKMDEDYDVERLLQQQLKEDF